jgi:hypothetical protein
MCTPLSSKAVHGGDATWEKLFGSLMGATIYMSEVIFITYMGIMEAPVHAGLGFVPLIVTGWLHGVINRNIRQPLETLSMNVAADVDEEEGELAVVKDVESFQDSLEHLLDTQPSLKPSKDERGPIADTKLACLRKAYNKSVTLMNICIEVHGRTCICLQTAHQHRCWS